MKTATATPKSSRASFMQLVGYVHVASYVCRVGFWTWESKRVAGNVSIAIDGKVVKEQRLSSTEKLGNGLFDLRECYLNWQIGM